MPARCISRRFDDTVVVDALLESRWWESDEAELRQLETLQWGDASQLVANVNSLVAITSGAKGRRK